MDPTAMPDQIGLDIGSTTIKLVVLRDGAIIYDRYARHHADISGEISRLLADVNATFPELSAPIRVTGSAGLGVAQWLDLPFVQEVIAETEAVNRLYPHADVIIELGGEDAKITYLHPVTEQRMNGTCAGGTGAFIDQMAVLLQTDASGLDKLAAEAGSLYPIASRCGVFAKSDLQPLLNDGASRRDLAASVLQAVVNQTIAGLACGRPIRGTVIFLGGPLHFMPMLRKAFQETLQDRVDAFISPDNAQLTVAVGAAMLADKPVLSIGQIYDRLSSGRLPQRELTRIAPLFASLAEKRLFDERHAAHDLPEGKLQDSVGPCYLGIDAGSTTTKIVLLDQDRRLLYSHYTGNNGKPVATVLSILRDLLPRVPRDAYIARACVTGYGENLIRAAFALDDGEVETLAHYKAAAHFCPDVNFIIDIGGQDMKCLSIRQGVIEDIRINEACSSGCGSFLQSFAETLKLQVTQFAALALTAQNPVDLGTRCTVFMNSRVKQALKEGATVGDISAGLSYSVVRNALYKVIKIKSPESLGQRIVAQGGTFLNDAVLRCFERVTGREVIRPKIAGLMGAFGAALLAIERSQNPDQPSNMLRLADLADFQIKTTRSVCGRCANQCRLTIARFDSGRRYISGNRCERGAGSAENHMQDTPDLFAEKYRRLLSYEPLSAEKAWRGPIGVPVVLNMYENYPFWFTILTELGFHVVPSAQSDHKLFQQGMETIPSESVCYPAKLAHGHVADLISRGICTIFYPDIVFEQKESKGAANCYNCPIVVSYPEVIKINALPLLNASTRLINPFFSLAHREKMADQLADALTDFGVTVKEARKAIASGFAEQERFKRFIRNRGREVLEELAKTGRKGIVLAGRPYHVDPEINHGIPQLITTLGLAVLTEDSIAETDRAVRPLRVLDQWAYHTRLYEAAAIVAQRPELELVQLNSFGCGLDAVTTDQVQEILAAYGKRYTVLKIDEINNLGAARIRLRSLVVTLGKKKVSDQASVPVPASYPWRRVAFDRSMKKAHTILAPQMSPIHFSLIESVLQYNGYNVKILNKASAEDVETGLKYVNNDACYPTIMVVGQIVNAFLQGGYDPHNASVFLTQTGGGCRASNYVAF
ncbi:MAG: acyl-CoA dehydratase activase-related protein, partial [Bacillota bacterium]|nr:acyl-CoA dehydratase activase-related protein [Bacillota bacterium]